MTRINLIVTFLISGAWNLYAYEMPQERRDHLVEIGATEDQIRRVIESQNELEDKIIQRLLDKYEKTNTASYIHNIRGEAPNLEAKKGIPIYQKLLQSDDLGGRVQSLKNIHATYRGEELASISNDLLRLQTTATDEEAVLVANCIGAMGSHANNEKFIDALISKIRASESSEVISANIDAFKQIGAERDDVMQMLSGYLDGESTPSNVLYAAYQALGNLRQNDAAVASNRVYRGVEGYPLLESIRNQSTILEGRVSNEVEDLVRSDDLRDYETLMLLDIFLRHPNDGSRPPFAEFIIRNACSEDTYISDAALQAFWKIKLNGEKTILQVISVISQSPDRILRHACFDRLMEVSPWQPTDHLSSSLCSGFLLVKNDLDFLEFIKWLNLLRYSGAKNDEVILFLRSLLDESCDYYSGKAQSGATRIRYTALLTLADLNAVSDEDLLVIADVITNSRGSNGVFAGIRAYSQLSDPVKANKENLRLLTRPLSIDFPDNGVNISRFSLIFRQGDTGSSVRGEAVRVLTEIDPKHLSEFRPLLEEIVAYGDEFPNSVKRYIGEVNHLLKVIK